MQSGRADVTHREVACVEIEDPLFEAGRRPNRCGAIWSSGARRDVDHASRDSPISRRAVIGSWSTPS
jgi:hypothetical protein